MLKRPSDQGPLDDLRIDTMHMLTEATILPVEAHTAPSHGAFSSQRKRAAMTIDAFDIVAFKAFFAGCLACNDAEPVALLLCELDIVAMRALVRFVGVVVAATVANVMLIAHLQLLEALHFVAVIVQRLIDAVAFEIAEDGFGWLEGSFLADEVGEGQG